MRIVRVGPDDASLVVAASGCFDHTPRPDATDLFLRSPDHHLLLAYVDDQPAGMVTGVELTHPDKGTEMFLYELGVEEGYRRRGIGRALVAALRALAAERGCHGMWVATDEDNVAALATYRSAGAAEPEPCVTLAWTFGAGDAVAG